MLDYRIKTFLTVYQTCSFTLAAQELHITQPAVSQHIRHLESHYGCALFAKHGHTIAPTPAADALYHYMLAMNNDEKRIEREIAELAHSGSGQHAHAPISLGCTRTIADYVAPKLIAAHIKRHPNSRISLKSSNTQALLSHIEQGELDIALVEGSFDRSAFDSEVFSREAFVAVAAPQFVASAHKHWHPKHMHELLDYPVILREHGSGTREILECSLAARNLAVDDFAQTYEFESIPAIKRCVKEGLGLTFIYQIAVAEELSNGALVDITPSDFAVQHDFCLVWQRGSVLADRYRALLNEWRAYA